MEYNRVPPQNIEAEQSTLGAMLISREAILKVTEILRSDDFYKEGHRIVFAAIDELAEKGEAVDLITVTELLRQKNKLDAAGGAAYLISLANSVATAANVEYHARIVAEKAVLRTLIENTTQIATACYENAQEVDALLDEAEQMVFAISQRKINQNFSSLRDVLISTFNRLDKLRGEKGGITGVPTGFRDLDYLTAGFQPSDLIIVAARPSMGKTTFCLNIAQYAAIEKDIPVAIFSLEMAKEQLVMRMLCAEAQVNAHRVRTGFMQDDDWRKLAQAAGPLSTAPIYIDDTPGISVMELRAKARRLKAEHGLGLIIIDYLQLMQGKARSDNRQQEISDISRFLKALARELEVPVIALSQLSRAVEQRNSKRPMLSDLRESGALEQDADLVAFIYRDDYYNEDSEDKNIAEIIVAKQRNGPVDTVKLYFMKEFTKFANLAEKRD